MSGLKGMMKDGWHPKGKEGGKESWRGDFKGINQVVWLYCPSACSLLDADCPRLAGWGKEGTQTRNGKTMYPAHFRRSKIRLPSGLLQGMPTTTAVRLFQTRPLPTQVAGVHHYHKTKFKPHTTRSYKSKKKFVRLRKRPINPHLRQAHTELILRDFRRAIFPNLQSCEWT
jgi:hypothetical protein